MRNFIIILLIGFLFGQSAHSDSPMGIPVFNSENTPVKPNIFKQTILMAENRTTGSRVRKDNRERRRLEKTS